MEILAGLFLIVHGLVHLAVWLPDYNSDTSPFDARRSWALAAIGLGSARRAMAVGVAVACAVSFAVAGAGVLAGAGWAAGLAMATASLSLLLSGIWFHPWLLFNMGINVAIIAVASR